MRARTRTAIVAALAAVLLTVLAGSTQATPTGAVTTSRAAAAPVVTTNLGRRLIEINLDPNTTVQCSAQGQLLDTNGNGLSDSLRGRAACKEIRGTARLRIYSVRVQSDFADTWADALVNATDAVSASQPAFVESFTPRSAFCPPPGNFNLTYRVRQSFAIRTDQGGVASFSMNSFQFQARAIDAAQNDVC